MKAAPKPIPVVAATPKKQGLSPEALRELRIKNLARGGKKGAKRKSTKLKEALESKALETVAGAKISPLEVMIKFMLKAVDRYDELEAQPVPEDDDAAKDRERQLSKARSDAMDAAIAAGPFVHAKLQSIDKSVKRNVRIQVISFADAPPLTKPE